MKIILKYILTNIQERKVRTAVMLLSILLSAMQTFPLSITQDKAHGREKQGKGKLFLPPGLVISSHREWHG